MAVLLGALKMRYGRATVFDPIREQVYAGEHNTFRGAFDESFSVAEARQLLSELSLHFRVTTPKLTTRAAFWTLKGWYRVSTKTIHLSVPASDYRYKDAIGILRNLPKQHVRAASVIHEFTHHLQHSWRLRYGTPPHDCNFASLLEAVYESLGY